MKNLLSGAVLLAFLAVQLGAQTATPLPANGVQSTEPAPDEGSGKSVDKGNCGMVYGKGHAFLICAPDGWILDNSIGNEDGIYAAFYPEGASWDSAREKGTVMYVNVQSKTDKNSSVAALMASDGEDVKKNTRSAVVKQGTPIQLTDLSIPIQLFAPGGFDRFEAVAYVDSPEVISMFIMTSKNEKAFKRDYPAFIQLVQSYKFLSSNVHSQHRQ